MTRATGALLVVGLAAFVALMAWQGFASVGAIVAAAGWGLAVVALFHVVPLVVDAAAIHVLLDRRTPGATPWNALMSRWTGEAANSLLPAGQVGGPVLMARYLAHSGLPMSDAAAAIAVSTTMQAAAQIVFAIGGIGAFAAFAANGVPDGLGLSMAIAAVVLAVLVGIFWWAQRRGLFGRALRATARLFDRTGRGDQPGRRAGRFDWSSLTRQADAIDAAVATLYRDRRGVAATFGLSLVGWIVGTGEVWLALHFLGHPVEWLDALLLESAGQAIRGAAFAIPGSLGAQEGGYLLLAPLVALPLEMALALSLVKRFREIALGLPGLLHLHLSERRWRRRPLPAVPAHD